MVPEENAIDTVSETKVVQVIKTIQSRWQSPVLWLSLAVKVVSVLMLLNILDVTGAEIANRIISIFLLALTGVSDANNPTNAKGL